MFTPQAVRAAIAASLSALLAVLLAAGSACAATDHVVITGGAVVPAGETAGDIVVLDGTVRIAGRATGDVVSVSGPVRVTGRIDGDLIAVSDRAVLGPAARVGGDLRYGDERPVLAPGANVGGKISNEDWADAANGWGWVSAFAWWLAVSVSTLIVGALLVWLAPGALYAAERAVRAHLGAAIGWGIAIAIGVPLLAILAPVERGAGDVERLLVENRPCGIAASMSRRPAPRGSSGRRRRDQAIISSVAPDAATALTSRPIAAHWSSFSSSRNRPKSISNWKPEPNSAA